MDRDSIWKLLGDVQSQVRVFDTKAQVALGIDGVLAGFLGAQLIRVAEEGARAQSMPFTVALGFSLMSFASMATSFALALNVVIPRLELKQPRSHFFFAHIVEQHGTDFDSAAKHLLYLGEERMLEQLGTQVAVNSVICKYKAERSRMALRATAAALAFYLLSLIPLSISAYEMQKVKPQVPAMSSPRLMRI
jgi:hypothetical protein